MHEQGQHAALVHAASAAAAATPQGGVPLAQTGQPPLMQFGPTFPQQSVQQQLGELALAAQVLLPALT